MKFARAILALLCGLTLLLPSFGPAAALSAEAAPGCGACPCVHCSCGVESSAPGVPAAPALPASNASSNEWQALLVDLVSIVVTPSAPAPPMAMPVAPSLLRVALPLYQRDCAYVI